MLTKMRHAAVALGIFVALAGVLLWMTGTFTRTAKAAEKEGHAPAADETTASEKAGCTDCAADLAELESKKCEHEIRQLDCDECRYELGVVKVQSSVTDALTKTAVVREGELSARLELTGEVQLDQTRVVDVLPAASGKIVSVKARLGQKVRAGDVLAVIHSSEFGEAKSGYLEAVASADIAMKERDRQQAVSGALDKLLEGIDRGQSMASGNGSPLGEWKAKLVGASARLGQAKAVFEREKALLAKQASSKSELETAERELRTAEAELSALAEEVRLNSKLDRLKAENSARLAEARLSAAEQRLHLFGLDDEAIKGVSHRNENGSFAQMELRAPRAGTITAQNVTEGKFVEPTQSLFTIADTSTVWVWCDVYERDLGALHEQLAGGKTPKATVRVQAFAEPLVGALDLIGNALDESTRTLKARVQVSNPDGRLRPGMFASVTVELPTGRKVALVPQQAVLSDEGKSFAFEHWKDDLWLKRDVVVGQAQGEMVEIASGLAPGAKVVCSGAFLLKSDVLRAKMGAGCAD